ncbi:MAG: tRNA preQ1(34) S-adenosylmethionine ribosyltransferase-isomerase QueA [Helicobacteraceae bacterium]|nr:tRNA preQ1(34) S-adenosylmethionine ribosyltransferase-isomerase QueA [Helicobacteraceae bacterium]
MSFNLEDYDYYLPNNLIANYPLADRASSKLLVYNRKNDEITHTIVREIDQFIPREHALIFNNSKVIKARIFGEKSSGGKIEILIARDTSNGVLSRVKGKVRVGSRLVFAANLTAIVAETFDNGDRVLKFFENENAINFARLIEITDKIGVVPLPPYIKRAAEIKDIDSYQSCFAKIYGSAAAPTASLHFDQNLLETLRKNHNFAEITLHIGLGTFANIEANDIRDHKMHFESYFISEKAAEIINSDQQILAIGTTACRATEFYFRNKELSGECDLFLNPENPPKRINALMTNFHLPKSTLFILISSMIGLEKTREIYAAAIANKYRFFSYGDAMLII